MDDQGAGGSSRGGGTNPERRQIRESSLPSTLLPHLYHGPRHSSFQRIAPLTDPDWSTHPTRPRSQDRGRSLPSPDSILRGMQLGVGIDRPRSLDASPVNPISVDDPDLSLPRPMPHALQPKSPTLQPLQQPSRQARPPMGIQDILGEEVGALPRPEMPVGLIGDRYVELGRPPGFSQEQGRGRSEFRTTQTSRAQRNQVQTQDRRITFEQGRGEGLVRDLQRQVEPFSSQSIRGTCPTFPRASGEWRTSLRVL